MNTRSDAMTRYGVRPCSRVAQSAPNHAPLAACIYLANMIAAFTGHGYGFQAFAMRGRDEALEILALKGDELPLYMIKTVGGVKRVMLLAAAA